MDSLSRFLIIASSVFALSLCQDPLPTQEVVPAVAPALNPAPFSGNTVVSPAATQEPSLIQILRNSELTAELEIVDSQADSLLQKIESIQTLYKETQKTVTASSKGDFERATELHNAHIEYSKQIRDAVSECLLPHQKKRLSQLALRVELSKFGWLFKEGSSIREAVELSKEQAQEIFENGPAFRKRLKVEVEEFIEKKRIEYLESFLDDKQKKKLHEALGDSPFQLNG